MAETRTGIQGSSKFSVGGWNRRFWCSALASLKKQKIPKFQLILVTWSKILLMDFLSKNEWWILYGGLFCAEFFTLSEFSLRAGLGSHLHICQTFRRK
jgi:hypothetical protein